MCAVWLIPCEKKDATGSKSIVWLQDGWMETAKKRGQPESGTGTAGRVVSGIFSRGWYFCAEIFFLKIGEKIGNN